MFMTKSKSTPHVFGHFPIHDVEGNCAKENVGPPKLGFDTLKYIMKTMVTPIYLKFDGKPM
jgi:hypothetical protein